MTTERVSGIRIDEREALVAAGHALDVILKKGADAFFNQVFRDGFFHADQHPGNLFVAADGAIAAVDFGIMGRLDRKHRYYLADMLLGFLSGDYRRVAEVHLQAGYIPRGSSLGAFTQACRSIGEPILGRPLHEISLARLLAQLFRVTEQFQMETLDRSSSSCKRRWCRSRGWDGGSTVGQCAGSWRGRSSKSGCATIAAPRRKSASASTAWSRPSTNCRASCARSASSSTTGQRKASSSTPKPSPSKRPTAAGGFGCVVVPLHGWPGLALAAIAVRMWR